MKTFSRYNHFVTVNNQICFYNARTRGLLTLQPQIERLIKEHCDAPDELAGIHPSLYAALDSRGFLVDPQTDEVAEVIAGWQRDDTAPDYFSITILPTVDCNLDCWYCYEKHDSGSYMTPEICERVKRLIDRVTGREGFRHLNLDFFGGEPLLRFKRIALPLMQYARQVTRERGIRLTVHFTTNAVLLTQETVDAIKALELDGPAAFQITLDGNRRQHDKVRCTRSKQPTYDTIVANIHRALKAGMTVNNRFNYTAENVETLADVMDAYADLTDEERGRLRFDFQQVWQDTGNTSSHDKATRLIGNFRKEGLRVSPDARFSYARCYADAENRVIISYDGSLYKCTARDFTPENREGFLAEDGTLQWNERYHRRMAIKYGNSTCQACSVFPICHGHCSQTKLETSKDGCLQSLSEKGKDEYLQNHVSSLLLYKG